MVLSLPEYRSCTSMVRFLETYPGSKAKRLLLVLTQHNHTSHLPYPIYDVGVHANTVTPTRRPLRLVELHGFQKNASAIHMNFRASLRTILLVRHRPRESPEAPIYLPLNHSFPPSGIRIPEHLFRTLLYRPTVTEVSIINAQLPWSGDPPFMTTFRVQIQDDVLYATILFGLCTSHSTNGEPGSLWATFRGGPSRWECTDYSHQCTVDHVFNWPSLERHFVVKIHAIHTEGLGDHVAKWMFHMAFTDSVYTGILVLTHITCDLRILPQSAGYYDFLEDEEERIKQTHVPIDADPQESPVSTHAEEPKGSSPSTVPIVELHQSATSHRRPRLGFPLHLLAWTWSTAPSAHQTLLFPLSISLTSMYPATLHSSSMGSDKLSLLLP